MQRSIPYATASVFSTPARFLQQLSFEKRLGLLFGIVMPVISALAFPTYVQMMPAPWMERARLLELPFVFSELLVIGWAFRAGFDRNEMLASMPADLKIAATVLLAAMFVSSALISPHPADALLQSLIQVCHLYFALAVFYLTRTSRHGSLDQFVTPMAVGLIVLAAYTAWWFGFAPDPSTLPTGKIDWNFAVPGFISARYLGTWCGAVTAALAIQLLYKAPHDRAGLYHLTYVVAAAMTIWSGTRAAIFGIGIALFVLVVCKGFPRWRALSIVLPLTALAVALAVLFRFHDPVFQLFTSGDSGSVNRFTAGRSDLWAATFSRWLDSPLLGFGTGSVFYEVDVGWTHTQPHNAFLQFLISWGLVGAAACCWLLGRAIRAAHVFAMTHRSELPLLGMIYALLAMSMLDGALYYPRFIIVIVGGLALILGRAAALSGNAAASDQPGRYDDDEQPVLAGI